LGTTGRGCRGQHSTLKLGDEVKITTRVTRIGDLGSVTSITLQLPNGERFTIPQNGSPPRSEAVANCAGLKIVK
jgi:hypothetical protein